MKLNMNTSLALFLGFAAIGLSACDTTGTPRTSGSGELRSEVEIIDGNPYTATWLEQGSTSIRLTYDSTVALSDGDIVEIAELMTGCTATGHTGEATMFGGQTTVPVPANCALQPAVAA